jgi:hypothetical protein
MANPTGKGGAEKGTARNPTGIGGAKKGDVRNPNGRPKKGANVAEILMRRGANPDWVADMLIAKAKEGNDSALKMIAEYTWGKPHQTLDVAQTITAVQVYFEDADLQQLESDVVDVEPEDE